MFYLAILISKVTHFLTNLLKVGSGYTFPGYLVLKMYPDVLKSRKIKFPKGLVTISGTNGKTTTTKLVTHILERKGIKVVHNKSGSNLLRGVVSAILLDRNIFGKTKSLAGVFEVDEFSLPLLLEQITLNVLVLLNLSRDQLDRYGEVDIILDKWKKAISSLSPSCTLVVDSTQERFRDFSKIFRGKTLFFNADSVCLKRTCLVGDFNAKNVNAAIETARALGFEKEEALKNLEDFEVAYGRGEEIPLGKKIFRIFLAKNPASFNNNLDLLIKKEVDAPTLLFVLNDNIPDGRDVSWIYDINPEKLYKACSGKKIFVSGKRYLDMAVRLSYAGIEVERKNLKKNLKAALSETPGENTIILPNYSAMLDTRKVLTGRKIL